MTTCFCGREIEQADRCIDATLVIDWGANDQRGTHVKHATFHSFQCLADWATRRAADHDSRVLTPDNPEFPNSGFPPATAPLPVVDTRTDTLIRKD